jgi:hypothetical protein
MGGAIPLMHHFDSLKNRPSPEVIRMILEKYPSLPFEDWKETKTTLHLFSQIVGKIRLTLTPKVNHWWHVPLYVSARGLTTRPIPYDHGIFEMELDFMDHDLVIETSRGETRRISLRDQSVASFYESVFRTLDKLGMGVEIAAEPFDSDRVQSTTPFPTDTTHKTYDADCANRFWHILTGVDAIFKEFRGRFVGKCSPVHFFWHSFDLAVTRFSGRRAPLQEGADPVTREAYSHEVISAGFWSGDANIPEPAFYSYVFPEPKGLAETVLRPGEAWWQEQNGSHMALLKYEDFRRHDRPRDALLDFLQSSYEAGAALAAWPRADLE